MTIKSLRLYFQQNFNRLIIIKEGSNFCWSSKSQTITFVNTPQPLKTWSLLHEAGHAVLNHQTYFNDFDLLQKELEAWQEAKKIADYFNLSIDQNHIENCLDSYRDWLDKRSQCPKCNIKSIQINNQPIYYCFNCKTSWTVNHSRNKRPYRTKIFN